LAKNNRHQSGKCKFVRNSLYTSQQQYSRFLVFLFSNKIALQIKIISAVEQRFWVPEAQFNWSFNEHTEMFCMSVFKHWFQVFMQVCWYLAMSWLFAPRQSSQRWGLESLDSDSSPDLVGLGLESHTFGLGLDSRHAGLGLDSDSDFGTRTGLGNLRS
jgi:hypothetical protein